MTFYDPKNKRLIYIGVKPTSEFWDNLWKKHLVNKNRFLEKIDLIVTPTTKKYLKQKSKILEGGCGHGTYVEILNKAGFNCIGVDFAKSTIKKMNQKHPELPIYYGNLSNLKFKNNSFDAYWSIGVIEHFYNGYTSILREMARVIKYRGYAFVTFPYMSPVRKAKAGLGLYEKVYFRMEPKNFYQFALDHDQVIEEFKKYGFKPLMKKPYDGFSGLRKELPQLGFILNPISKLSTNSIFVAGIRFVISKTVEKFASHSYLIVFQKLEREEQ